MSDLEYMSRFERTLFHGCEWPLSTHHWVVLQLSEGIAYARSAGSSKEVLTGGVVLSPPGNSASILASTLGPATLRGVDVRMNWLTGFLTTIERQCFETRIAPRCAPFLILPPAHPLGAQLAVICDRRNPMALQDRLGFLHLFFEVLTPFLTEAMAEGDTGQQDAVARLRQFVNQMPESELVQLTLARLAEHLHCCERHASRLFQELCGCGFRAHISELRLKKACALLANPKLKIINVAVESGHSSLAFFNYRFKRRFGVTPTEWRERHAARQRPPSGSAAARRAVSAALVVGLALLAPALC